MVDALDYFAALVQQDASIPLFEAALSIEQDEDPHLDLVAATAELDIMAAKLQKRIAGDTSAIHRLRILNQQCSHACGTLGRYGLRGCLPER